MFILEKHSVSITLLFFGGLLTLYIFLLSTSSSVAQGNGNNQYDDTNNNNNQYEDNPGSEITLPGPEITEPTQGQPLQATQDLNEEADSDDAISGASVDNTGDNAALCVPIQQTPITGNQQTEQGNLGVGSEGDIGFGDYETQLNPEQVTNCTQTIQPVSGA